MLKIHGARTAYINPAEVVSITVENSGSSSLVRIHCSSIDAYIYAPDAIEKYGSLEACAHAYAEAVFKLNNTAAWERFFMDVKPREKDHERG